MSSRAADDHMLVPRSTDKHSRHCADRSGLAELADANRFATMLIGSDRYDLFQSFRISFVAKRPPSGSKCCVVPAFPAGPITPFDQVFRDPQVLHRQDGSRNASRLGGDVRLVAPISHVRTSGALRHRRPLLGRTQMRVSEMFGTFGRND